jgi:hypothetical protein
VSSQKVFAVKTYSHADVNIGYRFVCAEHPNKDGKMVADQEVLNDVVEQLGGGGEPFHEVIWPESDYFHIRAATRCAENLGKFFRENDNVLNSSIHGRNVTHTIPAPGLDVDGSSASLN